MWNTPSPEQLALLPRLYETENIPLEEKIIHIHFFLAGCDWFIAEYDGVDLFWGYAILNEDYQNAEWGYISFSELKNLKTRSGLEIDRDLYWKPQKASEIQKIREGKVRTMTVAEFKDNLPYLHVRHNGKIYIGKTGGRLLPFCHVSLYDETGPIAGSFEVSWETALRCYNEGNPVIF